MYFVDICPFRGATYELIVYSLEKSRVKAQVSLSPKTELSARTSINWSPNFTQVRSGKTKKFFYTVVNRVSR